MKFISFIWLKAAFIFNPVQMFFNGNFWEVFAKKFGSYTQKTVVDLACGTGELRKSIKPKKYLGIDINAAYIDYARKNIKSENTKFILGNALEFSLPEKFDIAFLIAAAHHLSDQQLLTLFSTIEKNKIKNFILIDDIPQGFLSNILMWLDDVLGGGKYFRQLDELADLVGRKFKIEDQGTFSARGSFYKYRYIVSSSKA